MPLAKKIASIVNVALTAKLLAVFITGSMFHVDHTISTSMRSCLFWSISKHGLCLGFLDCKGGSIGYCSSGFEIRDQYKGVASARHQWHEQLPTIFRFTLYAGSVQPRRGFIGGEILHISMATIAIVIIIELILLARISVVWALNKRVSSEYCTGCGYCLRGNTTGICPECGRRK